MKKLYTVFFIFALSAAAFAQAGVSEQEAIQRRQEQEARDLLRRRDMERSQRSISRQESAPQEQAQGTYVSDEGCLDLASINISGVKKFNVDKVKNNIKNIIGPCITKEMLQQVQVDIQKMYVDKGYITARVYFDFKDLKDKRLNLIVVEGRLEAIVMINPKTDAAYEGLKGKLQKGTAFPFMEGRVLNLRDIEQGLEQMNRLQSGNAAMEIRPGREEGDSVVIVGNQLLPRNQIGLSYDNSGSNNTGKYRGSATYSRDNLLALNENIFLNATTTLWHNRDLRYSNSYTASAAVPFGYWTFTNSFNYSDYLTTTHGAVRDFESSGNSFNNALSIERMLWRGAKYKVASGLQLMVKDSENFIEGSFIESSSRTLSIGTLYMTGTYYSGLGSFYSKLSLNRGLPIFGALKDEGSVRGEPKAQFTSAALYVNYSRNFGSVNYSAALDSIFGFDDMFASEQMMLGGESTIRGFKENNAFGEAGFVIRQDLRVPLISLLGATQNEYINTALANTYLGAFIDYGYVSPKTYGDSNALAGAGGRLGCQTKYISGGFSYARAIYHPDSIPSEGNVFYFNVALNIAF